MLLYKDSWVSNIFLPDTPWQSVNTPYSPFNYCFNSAIIVHCFPITVNSLFLSSEIWHVAPMSHCNLIHPYCHNTPLTFAFSSLIEKRELVKNHKLFSLPVSIKKILKSILLVRELLNPPATFPEGPVRFFMWVVLAKAQYHLFFALRKSDEFGCRRGVIGQYKSIYENSCCSSVLE